MPLYFKNKSYYSKTEFEPGKTLYQILFEHLVDGRVVSQKALARKYSSVNPFIGGGALARAISKVELSLAKSPNAILKKKKFLKLSQGGANPVISRKKAMSKFTHSQKAVITAGFKRIFRSGRNPSNALVRKYCLKELAKKGLVENVILSMRTISKQRKKLGLLTGLRGRRPKRKR